MSDYSKYNLQTGEVDRLRLTICGEIYNKTTQTFLIDSGLKAGMTVLELGCGTGNMAVLMAKIVGPTGKVIAVDNSEAQLRIARETAESEDVDNIEFIQHDALELDYLDVQCDFIYFRWVLLFLPEAQAVVKKLYDKLKPGGVFSCEELHLKNGAFFSCPPQTVIDRWIDAGVSYTFKHIQNMRWDTCFEIYPWLEELGAQSMKILAHQPILKTPREKSFFRLGLLTSKPALLASGYPEEKLNKLMDDLVEMEKDEHVLVGCYRNLLMSGVKPK